MSLDQATRSADTSVVLDGLDDLPVDVFEIDGSGLTVESLTGGHGMTETGASSFCAPCTTSCWEQ